MNVEEAVEHASKIVHGPTATQPGAIGTPACCQEAVRALLGRLEDLDGDVDARSVTRAVLREIMMFRRGIKLGVIEALGMTLPLVIAEAMGEEPETAPDPFRAGERVEVYDALRAGWRDATVRWDQALGADVVRVKVDRIAGETLLSVEIVRRPGPYVASGGRSAK